MNKLSIAIILIVAGCTNPMPIAGPVGPVDAVGTLEASEGAMGDSCPVMPLVDLGKGFAEANGDTLRVNGKYDEWPGTLHYDGVLAYIEGSDALYEGTVYFFWDHPGKIEHMCVASLIEA